MSLKCGKWLIGELPGLVEEGVLSDYYAQALREHYEAQAPARQYSPVLVLFGVLGVLLMGGGLILIFGHNWNSLSRTVRTLLALLPLLVSLAVGALGLWQGRTSRAWRESVSVFNILMVASSIALIGQTYHIPGDLTAFLFIWMLLALPMIYLFQAVTPALIYLAGITAWAASVQYDGGVGLRFWLLYAALLPFAIGLLRKHRFSPAGVVLGWGLCLQAAWIGLLLERSVPGLWIIVYTGLFSLLYLIGAYAYSDAPNGWSNPFSTVGAAGCAVLALLLTSEWVWESIGWRYMHVAGVDSFGLAFWIDLLLVLLIPAAALVLLVTAVRQQEAWRIPIGAAPVLGVLGFALAAGSEQVFASMLLFNTYGFAIGLSSMIYGFREQRMLTTNGGMAVLSALLLLRFFDDAMPMAVRGIVFVLLGGSFLAANLFLVRRHAKRAI